MAKAAKRAARPAAVDWYYHRNNCETCAKSQAFLDANGIEALVVRDARKERLNQADALKLARGVRRVIATRGRAVVEFDMKAAPPTDAELLKAIIGPTGNLRAPAIRHGDMLVVGFNETVYAATLA